MGQFIVKVTAPDGPRYLEWSTIVDAPVTYGMTLAEFRRHYRREYGASGMRELPERLERAEATGTSSRMHASVDALVENNRAGAGETCLTLAQIVDHYCVRPVLDKLRRMKERK